METNQNEVNLGGVDTPQGGRKDTPVGVILFDQPGVIDTTSMSPRGQQFFSGCQSKNQD